MANRLSIILETVSQIINESNRARRKLTKGKKDLEATKQRGAKAAYATRGYRTTPTPKPGPDKYFGSQSERMERSNQKGMTELGRKRYEENIKNGMTPEQAASDVASYLSRGT